MLNLSLPLHSRPAANRKITGAKLVIKPVHGWGIRIRLQVAMKARDLALFDLALDSKLRGCDLVALRVSDLVSASGVRSRVMILQRKSDRPVEFKVTEYGQAARSVREGRQAVVPIGMNERRLIGSAHPKAARPLTITSLRSSEPVRMSASGRKRLVRTWR
jgi:hypothetical protein